MNRKKLLLLKKQNKLENKPTDKDHLKEHLSNCKNKVKKLRPLSDRLEHVHNAYSDKRFYFEAPKIGLGIRTKKGFKIYSKTERNTYLCTGLVTFREVRVEGVKYIVPHHILRENPNYKKDLDQYEKERLRTQGAGPRSKPKPSLCTKHPDWGRFRTDTNYFARGKVPLGKCTNKDGISLFKEYVPNPYPIKPHEGDEGDSSGEDEENGEVYGDSDYYDSEFQKDEESDFDTTSQYSRDSDEYYDEFGEQTSSTDEDVGPTGRPLSIVGIDR